MVEAERDNTWDRSLDECKVCDPGIQELRVLTSGGHKWTASSHHRPTFCNRCKEKFTGVPWHGMACEICKMKVHKRCSKEVEDRCKWTVMDSIPSHLQYLTPENSVGPHQWLQGNLPMGSRCTVCDKAAGSVLKLQDYRCLWCTQCVHDQCLATASRMCMLGPTALSVLPPIAVERIEADGKARIRDDAIGGDYGGGSPLLVLVNSKSGDNQGQRLIRKLRRLLNPIQVFDLIACGPDFPLTFFSQFDTFRVLVCGGDGTVGWVLSALDRLGLHSKCQLGILPLGTGNDLARVLGWGHAFYNDARLPHLIRTYERAHTRMLDRWSIMAIEGVDAASVKKHEMQIALKVTAVMQADTPLEVIAAVKSLCICVKELMERVQSTYDQVEHWERQLGRHPEDPLTDKCRSLLARLNPLMQELNEMTAMEESGVESCDSMGEEERARRERLVQRANSLKKALFDMLEYAELSIDRHNREAKGAAAAKRDRFKKKRSKTTPSALKVSASTVSSSSANTPPASPSINPLQPAPNAKSAEGSGERRRERRRLTLGESVDAGPSTGVMDRKEVDEWEATDEEEAGPSCVVQPPTPSTPTAKMQLEGDGDEEGEEEEECVEVGSRDNSADARTAASSTKPTTAPSTHLHTVRQSQSDCSLQELGSACASTSMSVGADGAVRRKNRSATMDTTGGRQRAYVSTADRTRQSLMDRLPALKRGILSSGLTGGSLIAEVLLLNANVFRPSPVVDEVTEEALSPDYKELKVMNNYFGIGLDAKIALDFHNKREEVPDKQRSRSKLFMWYGILGGKELMHRTYRNLDQRIRLECDGLPIDLPSLQGIVILNIPSYSGGANFWGESREDAFTVQSYDDKVLEVVALFGVIHVATSRVPNVVRLQNHRIAQCRHVKITIHGEEPIPVQVDGEPWQQPPGVLQIVHKNRAQLLVKNAQSFDASLRTWEEQRSTTAPSTPTALNTTLPLESDRVPFSRRAAAFVSTIEAEMAHLGLTAKFLDTLEDTAMVVRRAEQAADNDEAAAACAVGEFDRLSLREEVVGAIELITEQLESHLGLPCGAPKASTVSRSRGTSNAQTNISSGGSQSALGGASASSTSSNGPSSSSANPTQFTFEGETTNWRFVINNMRQEMLREEAEIREGRAVQRGEKRETGPTGRIRSFTTWIRNKLRRKSHPYKNAGEWSIDDVVSFLGSIGLASYADQFKANEITGRELMHLERGDIHELGVHKLGHAKRLQNAIADIREHAVDLRKYVRGGADARMRGGSLGALGGSPTGGSLGGSGLAGTSGSLGSKFDRAYLAPVPIDCEDESCEFIENPSNSSA